MTDVLGLLALIVPLCLDTFAIAAALGVSGLTGRRRLSLGLLFVCFEGGMPLVGLLLGASLSAKIGDLTELIAIAALGGLGIYLFFQDDEAEERRIQSLARSRGIAMLAVGFAVSLDELAIGFALGLVGVPIVPAVVLIAIQAFVVSQVGFALGSRVSERVREGAERIAGVALVAVAIALLVARFGAVSG